MPYEKGYSFNKDGQKVVDAEVVEKATPEQQPEGAKKGLSFKDRLKGQGSAFSKGVKTLASKGYESYKEYNKPENVLKRKKYQAQKTKLDAQISKNKAEIQKNANMGNPSQGLAGFGLSEGGGTQQKGKKKKNQGNNPFEGGFF